jgi:hypothetical protein
MGASRITIIEEVKMAEFTITINADDVKIINKIATQTSRTPRELIEHQITIWAEGQIEGYFIEKIRDKTTSELIALLGDIA